MPHSQERAPRRLVRHAAAPGASSRQRSQARAASAQRPSRTSEMQTPWSASCDVVGGGAERVGLEQVQELAPRAAPVPRAAARGREPARDQGAGEVLPRLGEVGIDAEGRAELGLRRRGAAAGEQRLPEVRVPLGEARRDADGALEAGARRGEVLPRARDHSEAVQGLGEVRPELERVLERHLGALGVARLEPGKAARELLGGARVDGRASGAAREEGEGGHEEEGGSRSHARVSCSPRAAWTRPASSSPPPPSPPRPPPRRSSRTARSQWNRASARRSATRAAVALAATAWLEGDREAIARVAFVSAPQTAGRGPDRGVTGTAGLRLSLSPAPLRAQVGLELGWARAATAAGPVDRLAFGADVGVEWFPARDLSASARAALRGVPGALSTELVLGLAVYF